MRPDQRNPEDGPPDLIELIKKLFNFGNKPASSSSGSSGGATSINMGNAFRDGKRVVLWLIPVVIILWALSGIFIVAPAQQAVILKFGKYVETVNPGPHWIPPFVESQQKINVQKVYTFTMKEQMLTQDENIITAAIAVQYRVDNPHNYLFKITDPRESIQQAASSALRQAIGDNTLDYALTVGRQTIATDVMNQLQTILSSYQTGLSVLDVTLQSVEPPEAVTPAFNDATKAREDQQSFVNQAEAYSRRVESMAKGQIARLTQDADAYQQEVVLRAQGDTARYLALLQAYQQSPAIMSERLYLDAMSQVFAHTTKVIVDGKNKIIYLPALNSKVLPDAAALSAAGVSS